MAFSTSFPLNEAKPEFAIESILDTFKQERTQVVEVLCALSEPLCGAKTVQEQSDLNSFCMQRFDRVSKIFARQMLEVLGEEFVDSLNTRFEHQLRNNFATQNRDEIELIITKTLTHQELYKKFLGFGQTAFRHVFDSRCQTYSIEKLLAIKLVSTWARFELKKDAYWAILKSWYNSENGPIQDNFLLADAMTNSGIFDVLEKAEECEPGHEEDYILREEAFLLLQNCPDILNQLKVDLQSVLDQDIIGSEAYKDRLDRQERVQKRMCLLYKDNKLPPDEICDCVKYEAYGDLGPIEKLDIEKN